MVNLRLPNLNGMTEKEKLVQLKRYLYQLIPELQFALETLEIELRKANSEIEKIKGSNGGN